MYIYIYIYIYICDFDCSLCIILLRSLCTAAREIIPYSNAHAARFSFFFVFSFFFSHFYSSYPLRTDAHMGKFSQFMFRPCQPSEYRHLLYRGICYARSAVTDDRNAPIIKRARRAARRRQAGRVGGGTGRETSWTIFRRRFATVGGAAEEWELLGDTRGERGSATGHREGGAFNRIATSATPEEDVHSLDGAHGERRSRGGSTSTGS